VRAYKLSVVALTAFVVAAFLKLSYFSSAERYGDIPSFQKELY
jgi:hypothetical protein